jgi:hypothetical protein
MDPLTHLYQRLREPNRAPTEELEQLEAWLRFWNDSDTDLGNLRNIEHWLARNRAVQGSDHVL